ncbi:MAG: Gfo/Idh/MocA family oxidoreductase [Planctomycetes bacterium]|nr:Gfo/Idh/MocA family oxidoreductase [Planctomycetota bacterium]
MSDNPVKIGVIGCGNISAIYLKNAKCFPNLQVEAVADLDKARAKARAQEFGVPKACSVRTLLKMEEIEVVLNLTIPKVHAKINLSAIKAGKHVYTEKPFAITRSEGKRVLEAATQAKRLVGCAPDTILGGGHQTVRKLIDEGAIGKPLGATAFMLCRGHETWHPDPEFYYKPGGGPMMDMGPYYLSDIMMLLGPVKRLSGSAQIVINPRTISSQPRNGQQIQVETPDHLTGTMDFAGGAVGTIIMSFAVAGCNLPRIEVYGTEGTICVPDPNAFGGQVRMIKRGEKEWTDVPLAFPYVENWRALGLADMARAIRTGRPHRATGQLAYHVLDVMLGFLDSSAKNRHYQVPSTFERPAAMPAGLPEGQLD